MPQQPDLLEPPSLTIASAAGAAEPRLWVRRLAIWKEPGGEKVREVLLRPGLNIVWSPDGAESGLPADQVNAIGHGSGKTLFCRLIRYCLGEDRFATETQRSRIAAAFLDGIVGAEVMLDGVCWAIVRPLGTRRRHMAVMNGNLDEIAAGEGNSTGLEPFIQAVDQSITTLALAKLIQVRADGHIWPVALAWLARDQECRFDDVLDWRSTISESDSPMPASGREKGPRLEALRAFLVAITPEEQETRAEVVRLDEHRRTLDQEVGHRKWEFDRTFTRLVSGLGLTDQTLPEPPLLIELMRRAGNERAAAVIRLPSGDNTDLTVARDEYEIARSEWVRLDGERNRVEASIPIVERLLSMIQGELPGLSFSRIEAESPICPICEVPIERALAEGCNFSHKLPDVEACRQRWAQRQAEFEQHTQTLQELRQARTRGFQQLAVAKQQMEQLHGRVTAIERVRDTREAAWYSSRRLQDDIEKLADMITANDAASRDQRAAVAKLESERGRLEAFRDKQARVFGQISEKFDPIVRYLAGQGAKGRVALSGVGIELFVDMSGDRETAAIASLKVLAFDLAALCLSIEGATRVPAFLIHDSPREADLGLSIYHRLFRLMREVEGNAEQPTFQYIITTTTRPPDDLTKEPWLRLTLRGSPGHERLLRCDL